MKWLAIALSLLLSPVVAAADIYLWRDGAGVKHYTNSKALVPPGVQAALVVEEVQATSTAAGAPETAPAPPEEPTREAVEIAYDPSALAAAFEEGWLRGIAFSERQHVPAPVNVDIRGPFVASTNQTATAADPWPSLYYPSLVTTSFDGGRSRHLTLRMLMQDQFAVDRGGPYLIVDRFPPRGPNLTTFLPRGLPMFTRPGSRVVTY